jgi:flavodoxin
MIRKLLCFFGFHTWSGHTAIEYPVPFCKHCGNCYDWLRYASELETGWHTGQRRARKYRAGYWVDGM